MADRSLAMLTSCVSNSTCLNAYNSFALADTVLTDYINTAVRNISNALPSSGNMTWNPGTDGANALSTWTTIPGIGSEIFGLHDGFGYAVMNETKNVTFNQAMTASDLSFYLSGGAESVETVLNVIAFRFYDHTGGANYDFQGILTGYIPPQSTASTSTQITSSLPNGSTSSKLSATSQHSSSLNKSNSLTISTLASISSSSKALSSSISKVISSTSYISSSRSATTASTPARMVVRAYTSSLEHASVKSPQNRKLDDLLRIAKLRGPARKIVKSLQMSNYQDLILPLPLSSKSLPGLDKRDCSSIDTITSIQGHLQAVSVLCSLSTIQQSWLQLSQLNKIIAFEATGVANQLAVAAKAFGVTQVDVVSSVTAAVSIVCNVRQASCFPSSNGDFWIANNFGNVVSVTSLALGVATGASAFGLAVNVACLVDGLALNSYDNAAKCCAQNCNSPACTAGGIACGFTGLQC